MLWFGDGCVSSCDVTRQQERGKCEGAEVDSKLIMRYGVDDAKMGRLHEPKAAVSVHPLASHRGRVVHYHPQPQQLTLRGDLHGGVKYQMALMFQEGSAV